MREIDEHQRYGSCGGWTGPAFLRKCVKHVVVRARYRMSWRLACAMATVSLGLLGTSTAWAQYRGDQPPVLATPAVAPSDGSTTILESFGQRYAELGRPRIALFWNRQLTDDIARQTYQKSSTESTRSESTSPEGPGGGQGEEKFEHAATTTINSQQSVDDNHSEPLDPRLDAVVKSAFLVAMRGGGVRFVDRTLMVRTAAVQSAPGADAQLNEMQALKNQADWIMQVVLVRDRNAPIGHSFRVTVEDIKSSTLLTELLTSASPPPHGSPGFAAVNGGAGFVRAPQTPASASEVGSALGVEVMAQLVSAL
jgi:hypothetical protein